MNAKSLIYDHDYDDLIGLFTEWREPIYRADQLWQGLYKQLWSNPDDFLVFPKSLRTKLGDYFTFSSLKLENALLSKDGGTRKTLFRLHDSQSVETVLMSYDRRQTLCISTQVGCAMGCVFCATGQMGFRRNLTSGEIIEQVLYFARQLRSENQKVTNVVVMGMGEPFHNYGSTMAAIDRMNHPSGMNMGNRRFTISTVGLVPLIRRFANERRQINLAVSLHAADDELRSAMLPINRKYPLDVLFESCQDYVEKTRRRISFEWALIRNVNDTPEQARLLVQRLRGLLGHVNVIPLNPTPGYAGEATSRDRARAFQAELEKHRISCTIRIRRGIDIQAGCGQLAIEKSYDRSG